MEVKLESYVEYELVIERQELKDTIDALSELLYNDNLGAVNLQFGNKTSVSDSNINVKFIHADKVEELEEAQRIADEAFDVYDSDEPDVDEDDLDEECEVGEPITSEDWEAILTALGFEQIDAGAWAEIFTNAEVKVTIEEGDDENDFTELDEILEDTNQQIEDHSDVTDRYAGQV